MDRRHPTGEPSDWTYLCLQYIVLAYTDLEINYYYYYCIQETTEI